MKGSDLEKLKPVGERKLEGESNLRDMTEVRVRELQDGSARWEFDEKNGRVRPVRDGVIGPWEQVD